MTGSSVTPSTWHCIVAAVPTAARSHQRALRVDQARHAPANAIALVSAIRFGFQMKVDSSIAEAETAIRSPATIPATGPAIDRASHHVTPTAAIPNRAICQVTASGESPAGQRRGRGQEVVVERAMVEVADRGRWPEQRDDAVLDEAPAGRACRGPDRRPTCRGSRGPAGA